MFENICWKNSKVNVTCGPIASVSCWPIVDADSVFHKKPNLVCSFYLINVKWGPFAEPSFSSSLVSYSIISLVYFKDSGLKFSTTDFRFMFWAQAQAYQYAVAFLQVCYFVFLSYVLVTCGLLSPRLYNRLKLPNAYEPEWSSIMRCMLFFVGISHATAKIDFISLSQLLLTSFTLAMGIWWLFDRSLGGMFLGTLMSLLGTGTCFLLGNHPVIK